LVDRLMKRREFLTKSASFILGGYLALRADPVSASGEERAPECSRPRLALIIDDIGNNPSRARQFLSLGIPITYAILPRLPHTQELAHEIHREGQEILLHQPMEPMDRSLHPGPGALYVGDGGGKIARTLMENLDEVPNANGVNNHMGSRFTSCRRETECVLEVVRERGLFFLDSLTSSRSVACETARRLQVPSAARHIFLDHDLSEEAVLGSMEKLRVCALRRGRAIGIGHPHPETLRGIRRTIGLLRDSGVDLVHVSDLIPPCGE
jgi:uncharacterized protein